MTPGLEGVFQSIIGAFPLLVVDHSTPVGGDTARGIVVYANPLAVALFNYYPGSMNGISVEELIPDTPGLRDRHKGLRAEYASFPSLKICGSRDMLLALKRGGEVFRVAITLSPWMERDKNYVSVIITSSKDGNGE